MTYPKSNLFFSRVREFCSFFMCLLNLAGHVNADVAADSNRQADRRLTFQTSGPWSPRTAVDADVAICYGVGNGLPARLESWRSHGYRTEVMTGVSWGQYQDYLHGQWDGLDHQDERQTDINGNPLQHGKSNDVWYMSPGKDYGRYLTEGVKRALDAGAEAIYLEEPEFWVRAGYEPSFRRAWKTYFGEDWQPPHQSVDSQYRASKLKYDLYRQALSQVFEFVKKYGKEHGDRSIPCYVPTHSLLNYAHWRIVSPESSLIDVGCDGYIAQVWTGTSRTPNVYEGVRKSRTFETAFLEYGAMQNLVRASGRKVWYLNDPIEDNPNHSWDDYRTNWESTLIASLLQPEVWRFEVMPWPDRIFNGKHNAADAVKPATPSAAASTQPQTKIGIPREYETELQAVITAMGDLRQPSDKVRWEACGTQGIGVLVSDTMMFQRGDPTPSDPHLGSFYGLAMPLVKRGMPIEPVQIESATTARFLDRYKVLLLTYEGQKPPTPQFHNALASWVRAGGALVVIDDDKDPYHAVREWWNTPPMQFRTPRHHLFQTLQIAEDAKGLSHVGKGVIVYAPISPSAMTYDKTGANQLRNLTRTAAEAIGLEWKESAALVLRRGPYLIAAGLDEATSDKPPVVLNGRYISLFDPALAIINAFTLVPGSRAMLLDVVSATAEKKEGILAAACGVREESVTADAISFRAFGVAGSNAVVCIASRRAPKTVTVGGILLPPANWHFDSGLLWMRFQNSPEPVAIEVKR